MTSLTVIIPSSGRPSLKDTVDSVIHQLRPDLGDWLLVQTNNQAPWGNALRQEMMGHARTDAMLFMDDDDFYTPGALDVIRTRYAETPKRVHIFKMLYAENDFVLWTEPVLRVGNVASQMICVPTALHCPLGGWGDRYEGDFDFIHGTCQLLGEPIWHEEVIALVHHPLLKGSHHNPREWADAHH